MKQMLILVMLTTSVLPTSCSIDNYAEPDAGIDGTLIDLTTGKGLISEQPNGFRIRYRELDVKYPDAPYRDFWGKADGTFMNTKLFAVTYEVYPYDGAFVFLSDKQKVTLRHGERTTFDFSVTPFVSITDFDVQQTGIDTVVLTFKLRRNVGSILDYRIFATNRTPLVGNNATDNVGGDAVPVDESDLDSSGSITLSVIREGFDLHSGSRYWFRVGARCRESPTGRYNMSEIVSIGF